MIIYRYLLRGIAIRLGLILPILVLIYVGVDVGEQGRVLARTLGWKAVLQAEVLHLPLLALQLLPAALLLSIVFWLGRLRQAGELEALASFGCGWFGLVGVLLAAGTACGAASLLADELLIPRCEQKADRLWQGQRRSALTGLDHRAGQWLRKGGWFLHRDRRSRLFGVEVDARFSVKRQLEGQLSLSSSAKPTLRRATVVRFDQEGKSFQTNEHAMFELSELGGIADLLQQSRAEAQSASVLHRRIERGLALGQHRPVESLLLHTKLAYPLVNLLVALCGALFAYGFQRRSLVRDLGWALLALLGIWFSLALGWMLGRTGILPAAVAVWAPLGLVAVFSVLLLWRYRPFVGEPSR